MHNHNKPMQGLLLFFITLVGFAVADVSSGTINLGMSLTTTPADSALAQEGNHILHGLQYWLETIDSTSKPIRGSTFRFELKILEDDGSIEKIISNYQRLLNDTQVDYLIGPVDADANIFVSELTNSSGRLLLAPTSVETGYYLQKKLSFSVLASALSCLRVTFPFFRLHGDRKVALLVSESSELKEGCEGLTDKEAAANGLEIVGRYSINASLGNISEYAQDQINVITDSLIELRPDMIIGCAFGDTGELVLQELRRQNYSPHLISFLPLDDVFKIGSETQLFDFVSGCSHFETTGNFLNDPIFGGTQQFVQGFQNRFNEKANEFSAVGAMTGLIYQHAIEQASSFSQVDVGESMLNLNLDTFMGHLLFGTDHGNEMSCLFVQMVNGTRRIIGPPLAQLERFSLVDPFPRWDEREFVRTYNAYKSEWVFFSLALLGITFSVALLIYTLVKRSSPVIKASSPNLLIVFLIGSMLLYSSIWSWTLSNVTIASCYLQSWLLSFGFTIMFGALFAKSWRVYKLSSNTSLKIFKITDKQLLFIILVMLAGNIVICAVQAGVVDMTPLRLQVDQYRPAFDYEECPVNQLVTGISASLIVYNGVICLGGLVIAWKIRKLQYSVYNESKIIAFSMYNAAFFAILVIALQFTNATERGLLYILRSAGIVLGTAVSVATLFVSKLTMNGERHSSRTVAPYTSASHQPSSVHSAEVRKVQDLQKRLEEKEKENEELRKLNGEDSTLYQLKCELFYNENLELKNQVFELRNLIKNSMSVNNKIESNESEENKIPSRSESSV